MIGRKRPVNHKARYYLSKWYNLDSNIDRLSSVQMVQAKVLYASLQTLGELELKLLEEKYRVDSSSCITDSVIAKRKGITLKDYTQNRIEIETKLNVDLEYNSKKYKEELSKAVTLEYSK